MSELVGQTLGHYRIVEKIGAGEKSGRRSSKSDSMFLRRSNRDALLIFAPRAQRVMANPRPGRLSIRNQAHRGLTPLVRFVVKAAF